MVHFPGLAHTLLWIQRAVIWFYQIGFPHSDIPGSKPACGSPRLFAACHVLLRLLAPRHPPYALSSLTIKLTQCLCLSAELRSDLRERGTSPICSRLLSGATNWSGTVLQAVPSIRSREPLPPPPLGAGFRARRAIWQVRLSTCATLQILRFCALRASRLAKRNASFLSCQRPSVPSTTSG